ncbi:hypothetical protein B0J14DRAFT_569574 [Halenospora varia]|nr:hypothetical protein B0J14DRAFT_569574 [Halenospora varia]
MADHNSTTERLEKQRALMTSIPEDEIPETPPIKSTKLRRFLVLAAVKILKRIRPQKGTVLFISDNLCLKFGTLKHLPEASTLQFIARNTSIPVPKVHYAFTRKG